eukprot:4264918-Amphidinium_carterae.1
MVLVQDQGEDAHLQNAVVATLTSNISMTCQEHQICNTIGTFPRTHNRSHTNVCSGAIGQDSHPNHSVRSLDKMLRVPSMPTSSVGSRTA